MAHTPEYNMKKFEEEFGNAALDAAEAQENWEAAERRAQRLKAARAQAQDIAFWSEEANRWALLYKRAARKLVELKTLRRMLFRAEKEGRLRIIEE